METSISNDHTFLFKTFALWFPFSTQVEFIITDNASNMKCAFKVRFPAEEGNTEADDDSTDNEEVLDDESLWEDLNNEDEAEVLHVIDSNCQKRLSCFAHSLQLVIGDGLKETKGVAGAIAKANKLAALLHRSTTLKDRYD